MLYALRSSSRSRWSTTFGGLVDGGGMISLSQPARLPGGGLSPDTSSSGSVCMFSALGPVREGAGLGDAAGAGVVPDLLESRLSLIAASVVGVGLPGSSCGCNTNSADRACTAARVIDAACAASGSPGWTCGSMVGGVVARLPAVAPASQPWVPPAAYTGVCSYSCGHSGRRCGAVVWLRLHEGCTDGADLGVTVYGAASGSCGPGVVSLVLEWGGAVYFERCQACSSDGV